MAISSDYARPVNVNGYICHNCDDVSAAKKFIDPAAPKGVEAAASSSDSAFTFGGSLTGGQASGSGDATSRTSPLVDRYA